MTKLWALLLVVACHASPAEELTNPTLTPPPTLHMTWQMTVENEKSLRVDYVVTNGTSARVTVVNRLHDYRKESVEEVVVRADDDQRTIAFTKAFVPPAPEYKFEHIRTPSYVDIAPGTEVHGTVRTRLPLGASNRFGIHAIQGVRTRAVFEIGYFDDPAIDASNVSRPKHYTPGFKVLRGNSQPLPSGVTLATPEEQVDRSYGSVIIPVAPSVPQ